MNKTELKPGIFIEGFSFSKSCNYLQRTIDLSDDVIYEGKTSEIPEELAIDIMFNPWDMRNGYPDFYNKGFYLKSAKESIQSALTIAETGHLVFSVLHTNSAAQTIDRIIDVFPASSKEQVKVQLASVITAIVSQRLIPAIGGGMVPAFEVLMTNPAVRNTIREGKTFMIDNIIQTSGEIGMISLDSYLAKLVVEGRISQDVATNFSSNPLDFNNRLRNKKIL